MILTKEERLKLTELLGPVRELLDTFGPHYSLIVTENDIRLSETVFRTFNILEVLNKTEG